MHRALSLVSLSHTDFVHQSEFSTLGDCFKEPAALILMLGKMSSRGGRLRHDERLYTFALAAMMAAPPLSVHCTCYRALKPLRMSSPLQMASLK